LLQVSSGVRKKRTNHIRTIARKAGQRRTGIIESSIFADEPGTTQSPSIRLMQSQNRHCLSFLENPAMSSLILAGRSTNNEVSSMSELMDGPPMSILEASLPVAVGDGIEDEIEVFDWEFSMSVTRAVSARSGLPRMEANGSVSIAGPTKAEASKAKEGGYRASPDDAKGLQPNLSDEPANIGIADTPPIRRGATAVGGAGMLRSESPTCQGDTRCDSSTSQVDEKRIGRTVFSAGSRNEALEKTDCRNRSQRKKQTIMTPANLAFLRPRKNPVTSRI
jgi:hypothetical protein